MSDQAANWNGPGGRAWVDEQELLDGMLAPLQELLADAVNARPGRRVLDVGCGTGSTTLAYAAAAAECVGVDLSAPMIELARERAREAGSTARFVCADAQTHAFAPESFDVLVSRFGVMFFPDPVAAFANLGVAAAAGAELRFVAWRPAADNPFMTTAARAAAPLVGTLPAPDPDAPGQFAFGDRDRVARILGDSGWTDVAFDAVDADCTMPEPGLARYLARLGPLGQLLEQVAEPERARVVAQVRAAFDDFVVGDEVRFTAACWLVTARRADGRGSR